MDYWSRGQIKAVFLEHEVRATLTDPSRPHPSLSCRATSAQWAVYGSLSRMQIRMNMVLLLRLNNDSSISSFSCCSVFAIVVRLFISINSAARVDFPASGCLSVCPSLSLKIASRTCDMVDYVSFFHMLCVFECCSNYWVPKNMTGELCAARDRASPSPCLSFRRIGSAAKRPTDGSTART